MTVLPKIAWYRIF